MKRHFEVFLFIAVLSLIAIFSESISKQLVESYKNSKTAMSVPSSTQIRYQLASV